MYQYYMSMNIQKRSHKILIGVARLSTKSASAGAECAAEKCVCWGGGGGAEEGRRLGYAPPVIILKMLFFVFS